MANMKEVNKYIKTNYPNLEIEAVRGEGYVYFVSKDHEINSIYAHPVSTDTNTMADLVLEEIQSYLLENKISV
jgi:hypothetical protein